MAFDFDKVISRHGTNAVAAEGYKNYLFGKDDPTVSNWPDDEVIQMWVADMQFATPPCVTDAIMQRLEHPIFGYTMNFDNVLYDAFNGWCARRYNWTVDRAEFFVSQGVVPALYALVDCLCGSGDKIMTLTPAYGYFKHATTFHQRDLVTVPLRAGKRWEIDFKEFSAAASDPNVKAFFLCHPHNPTGQEWSEQDLRRMGEICLENNVLVISDEIHCDLLRNNQRHIPFGRLFPDNDLIVTCMSPSKTFNLAGLMTGIVVIRNQELRGRWLERTLPVTSPLGLAAATAAFSAGDEWLNELQQYLDGNFNLLNAVLHDKLPKSRFNIPDATYLAWIDLGAYFSADINLTKHFYREAGVVLEGGEMFVADGAGHIRLNLACPRSVLNRALERIVSVVG